MKKLLVLIILLIIPSFAKADGLFNINCELEELEAGASTWCTLVEFNPSVYFDHLSLLARANYEKSDEYTSGLYVEKRAYLKTDITLSFKNPNFDLEVKNLNEEFDISLIDASTIKVEQLAENPTNTSIGSFKVTAKSDNSKETLSNSYNLSANGVYNIIIVPNDSEIETSFSASDEINFDTIFNLKIKALVVSEPKPEPEPEPKPEPVVKPEPKPGEVENPNTGSIVPFSLGLIVFILMGLYQNFKEKKKLYKI